MWAPLLLAVGLVALCRFYLDVPVAAWVASALIGVGSSQGSLGIPDLLLPLVVAVTVLGWIGRFALAGKPSWQRMRRCAALLGIVTPASYVAKEVFKILFGRIQTPMWVMQPAPIDFHWFQGFEPYNGFPSGHMLVVAAIAAVLWQGYPRLALVYAAGLVLLAAALVLTDYHFLGDVVAGAYGGLFVFQLMTLEPVLKLFRVPAILPKS
jgi:membrane-associated phospholipid phosphatase